MPKSECFCIENNSGHSCERAGDDKRFKYDKIMIGGELTIINGYMVDKPIEECEKYISGEFSKNVIKTVGEVAVMETIQLTGVERKRLRKLRKLNSINEGE